MAGATLCEAGDGGRTLLADEKESWARAAMAVQQLLEI